MRSKQVWRLSFILLFVVIVYGAYSVIEHSVEGAQEQAKAEKKLQGAQEQVMAEKKQKEPSQDWEFFELRNERDKLEKEIRDIEKSLDNLTTQRAWLQDADKWNKELLAKSKGTKTPTRIEELQMEELQRKIDDAIRAADAPIGTLPEVNGKIKTLESLLKEKKDRKDKVETEMNRKIDLETPKQNFKKTLSITFAILIGTMIAGFFVIAWRDDIVRREIFHGQAGIQFITLFSVVIAIILFGILNILEGKELAALLGGLSGYILGRVTTPSAAPQPKTPVSSPAITSISPVEATVGAPPVPVQIVGNGLQLASSVKIIQGANEVLVSDITSNDQVISCKITLNANQPKGSYDVIVTNSDGAVAKLPKGFTVK